MITKLLLHLDMKKIFTDLLLLIVFSCSANEYGYVVFKNGKQQYACLKDGKYYFIKGTKLIKVKKEIVSFIKIN